MPRFVEKGAGVGVKDKYKQFSRPWRQTRAGIYTEKGGSTMKTSITLTLRAFPVIVENTETQEVRPNG